MSQQEYIIQLLGWSSSGKSTFLAIFQWLLKESTLPGMQMAAYDDATREFLERRMRILCAGQTQPTIAETLTLKFDCSYNGQHTVLVFREYPGEMIRSPSQVKTELIHDVDAILVLLAPNRTEQEGQNYVAEVLVKLQHRFELPVGVVLTKRDLLKTQVDTKQGGWEADYTESHFKRVYRALHPWRSHPHSFCKFFSISAFSKLQGQENETPPPESQWKPFQVEEPILWLLNRIPEAKEWKKLKAVCDATLAEPGAQRIHQVLQTMQSYHSQFPQSRRTQLNNTVQPIYSLVVRDPLLQLELPLKIMFLEQYLAIISTNEEVSKAQIDEAQLYLQKCLWQQMTQPHKLSLSQITQFEQNLLNVSKNSPESSQWTDLRQQVKERRLQIEADNKRKQWLIRLCIAVVLAILGVTIYFYWDSSQQKRQRQAQQLKHAKQQEAQRIKRFKSHCLQNILSKENSLELLVERQRSCARLEKEANKQNQFALVGRASKTGQDLQLQEKRQRLANLKKNQKQLDKLQSQTIALEKKGDKLFPTLVSLAPKQEYQGTIDLCEQIEQKLQRIEKTLMGYKAMTQLFKSRFGEGVADVHEHHHRKFSTFTKALRKRVMKKREEAKRRLSQRQFEAKKATEKQGLLELQKKRYCESLLNELKEQREPARRLELLNKRKDIGLLPCDEKINKWRQTSILERDKNIVQNARENTEDALRNESEQNQINNLRSKKSEIAPNNQRGRQVIDGLIKKLTHSLEKRVFEDLINTYNRLWDACESPNFVKNQFDNLHNKAKDYLSLGKVALKHYQQVHSFRRWLRSIRRLRSEPISFAISLDVQFKKDSPLLSTSARPKRWLRILVNKREYTWDSLKSKAGRHKKGEKRIYWNVGESIKINYSDGGNWKDLWTSQGDLFAIRCLGRTLQLLNFKIIFHFKPLKQFQGFHFKRE